MSTCLKGLAHHLPAEQDLGAVRRPIFSERGGPSDLVLEPAHDALQRAGLDVGDAELIIFATMTPDVTFPGAACYLQHKLKAGTVGALDIRAQCSGFLFGLMIADSFLSTGTYRNILLAAAEVHSSGLDYTDRGARIAHLYGDGAAAAVLGNGSDGGGLRAVVCHSDGRAYDKFWCEYPASRQHPVRITAENFAAGKHFPTMDFDEVRRFGQQHLAQAVREALDKAGIGSDAVDLFIFSHILPEVSADSARSLAIASTRWIDAGSAHGHLTAATLPLTLSESMASGRIGKGAKVCLAACGAGFNWGAAILEI